MPLLVCIHGGGCNGGYFELGDCPVLSCARARGFPVLLLDRPGYGMAAPAADTLPIATSARGIEALVDRLIEREFPHRPVFLVGHSIGAAVTLMLAAGTPAWSLAGVAVSGIGDVAAAGRDMPGQAEPAAPDATSLMGPLGSWSPSALLRLRRVREPWNALELTELTRDWPRRWRDVASAIEAPVHLRLAEHERFWETGQSVVKRMAAALYRSARVDAAILPHGGHLYELHTRGPELVEAQLSFAARR